LKVLSPFSLIPMAYRPQNQANPQELVSAQFFILFLTLSRLSFVREYEMGPKNDKVSFNLVLVNEAKRQQILVIRLISWLLGEPSRNYDNLDAKVIEK
jgi:hypothetical protein